MDLTPKNRSKAKSGRYKFNKVNSVILQQHKPLEIEKSLSFSTNSKEENKIDLIYRPKKSNVIHTLLT